MREIQKIVVQRKSDEDYRGFAIVEDSEGNTWELRGCHGESVDEAKKNAVKCFEDDEENWDIYGYII